MDRITASNVFIAIVEQGSLVGASESLGMSRSMVTRYLAEMEDWAGARLLHRSTRRLSLTNTGEKVLEECYKLQAIEREVKFASNTSDQDPQGVIRIATSQSFGDKVLIPFANEYLNAYPRVTIDMQINNHSVNLVEERIDLAIRITNDLDPNIIARKLGVLNSVVCASEDYLKRKGHPTHIDQLVQHNCLTYSYFGNTVWSFTQGNQFDSVAISGNLSANDPALLLHATLLGTGISLQPKYFVMPYIENGELIPLFPDYTPQTLGIYGIYKSRKHMSKALRVFIDDLARYITSFDM